MDKQSIINVPVHHFYKTFAPGKIIIFGEHSAVYGYPALAAALPMGVTVNPLPGNGLLKFPELALTISLSPASFNDAKSPFYFTLQKVYSLLVSKFNLEPDTLHYDFTVTFAIPHSAGLGSSSALCLALARCLSRENNEYVLGVAKEADQIFHGTSSGLDPAISYQAGLGLFQRELGLIPLTLPPLKLCIGLSGKPKSTQKQVLHVRKLLEESEALTHEIFARISTILANGITAWQQKDYRDLGKALNQNHECLKKLEMSSSELEQLCDLALQNGAVGAKLTGAGGGGCVIALAPDKENNVCAAWREAGYSSFIIDI